jgi:hypothetical protein
MFLHLQHTPLTDGGKVVSLTHRPPLALRRFLVLGEWERSKNFIQNSRPIQLQNCANSELGKQRKSDHSETNLLAMEFPEFLCATGCWVERKLRMGRTQTAEELFLTAIAGQRARTGESCQRGTGNSRHQNDNKNVERMPAP